MRIGTVKEIKNREARVGLTPAAARELVAEGHEVFVETQAGALIGYDDDAYQKGGCTVLDNADDVFEQASMIIKVKEPQPVEIARLTPKHTLFTYLHLAPDPEQARGLAESGATCIAYETVLDEHGKLPLLTPMSEVAGRLSVQAGAQYLEIANGGSGVLLGGVTGVAPAKVLIIGGGVSGLNAAQMAIGLGADVTILDKSIDRLRELDIILGKSARTLYSTQAVIDELLPESDLVIGAVLAPGAKSPKVVSSAQVSKMRAGSVMVDIAIDQGGCFETSRPTSHDDPIYSVHGVTHYCVTNMPAAVARTSAHALVNATLPYALKLASLGVEKALNEDPLLAAGLNVYKGEIVHPSVQLALGLAA